MPALVTASTPSTEIQTADAEIRILDRLRAGDSAAFETIVREFGPRMLQTAKRLLGNESDAQDALQDAFIAAYKHIGSFGGRSRLSTWLHRIVVNAALMRIRTRNRRTEVSFDSLLPSFDGDGSRLEVESDWASDASEELEAAERRQMVRDSLNALPERHRTIIMLRDIEELDTDATAQVLGITVGAVKTRLHRAHQALLSLISNRLGHSEHSGIAGRVTTRIGRHPTSDRRKSREITAA